MSDIIFERRIEFPRYEPKTKTHILATPNTASKWLRFHKKSIRDNFTSHLREFVIPEPAVMYKYLHIDYRLVRHNNRKIDADSASYAIKWFNDLLEDMGYIKDDKDITVASFPTIIDKLLPETMIDIRVLDKQTIW